MKIISVDFENNLIGVEFTSHTDETVVQTMHISIPRTSTDHLLQVKDLIEYIASFYPFKENEKTRDAADDATKKEYESMVGEVVEYTSTNKDNSNKQVLHSPYGTGWDILKIRLIVADTLKQLNIIK